MPILDFLFDLYWVRRNSVFQFTPSSNKDLSMPIYEYQCQDCHATLEILLDIDANGPKRCGFRCLLKRGEMSDLRGFGTLCRQFSSFAQVSEVYTKDHPTATDAAKVGLSTYENQGDGTFKKVAGQKGPETLRK
jgi:DNA-directed RNA polymerase subunit RPC12/RpoP